MKSLNTLIRPDLLNMEAYSSARDEFTGKASVFLDANENPYENGVNRYPDPFQKSLKKRIAEIKHLDEDQIFLGNGSDECIDLLFRLFCIPGKDEVTTIKPSYGMYTVSARINGVKIHEVSLNSDFSLNVETLLETAKKSRLLLLCSPNNPTGNNFSQQDLLRLIQNFKGIVLIDEAYIDFSETKSCTQLITEYKNLAVIQTFSKAYGMAGIRLGMLFSNPELICWLNKIKAPYNISKLTQNFALAQLNSLDKIQAQINEIKAERKKMIEKLGAIPLVEQIFPSDANFILIKCKNADRIHQKLTEKGIVVRNRSKQFLCESCLRVTIGNQEENEILITELQKL